MISLCILGGFTAAYKAFAAKAHWLKRTQSV